MPNFIDNTETKTSTKDKQDKSKSVTKDIFEDYNKPFSDYTNVAKQQLIELIDLWKLEIQATAGRRLLRQIRINKEDEVRKRHLEEDEAWCPVHLVDSNINREQAKYAQYILKPNRNAIITCIENPALDTSLLVRDFTDKSRYNEWELPPLQTVDGMQTHGWDALEIEFDTSKPGHFSTSHISHEKLLFPTDSKKLQQAPFCVRLCDYTNDELISFTKLPKNAWNKEQVLKSIQANTNAKDEIVSRSDLGDNKKFKLNQVEKVFFRNNEDGFIYVAWSCAKHCDGWLREPKLLFLGKVSKNVTSGEITQLYETSYPIELFPYTVSENELIFDIMGRVEYDEHTQEAATSLLSTFVTGHRRSITPYFTTDKDDGASIEEIQTNIKLLSGRLMTGGVKPWQLPAPEEGALNAVNTLIGQSQMESGDVNYAVQSNKSTRKTAAEVNLASSEDALLSTVQQSLLSISMRNTWTRCFDIYQARVRAGLIIAIPQVVDMLTTFTFIVKPAGDVDVVERQQKVQLMMQVWQIYQQTGASSLFLKNLTQLLFPDEAEQYINAFAQDDVKNGLISKLSTLIQSLIIDPTTGMPHKEFAQYMPQLQQLEMAVKQVTALKPGDNPNAAAQAPANTLPQLPPIAPVQGV